MKAEDLYRLMEHPEKLTEETLPQLKLIVDEFPYFSIARLLYLKNLAKLNDVRFGSALKKMAVCVPDRRKLFMLIEGEHFGLHLASVDEKEQAGQSDAFSLIDAFLSNQKQAVEEKESPLFEPSASVDYLHWSLSETHTRTDETPDVPLQHQDLIDSFIEKDLMSDRSILFLKAINRFYLMYNNQIEKVLCLPWNLKLDREQIQSFSHALLHGEQKAVLELLKTFEEIRPRLIKKLESMVD